MLIEYDHASGLTPTQRMDSLVASVQRALEELAETAGSGKGEKEIRVTSALWVRKDQRGIPVQKETGAIQG